MTEKPGAVQVGYVDLLRGNRSFRLLFSARVTSLFGDWFNTLALLALLRDLGGVDASSFAWILILKSLPALAAAPLAGILADRLSRRRILIATDLLRAVIVGFMLCLLWLPSVGLLYTLVVLQTMLSALFEPARAALLPDLVKPEELTAANAIGAAAWSTMLTLGSAAGGVFTAYLGWELALVVDVLTYLVSAALLQRLREPARCTGPKKPARSLADLTGWAEIREGLSYVMERPRVLSLLLVKSGWCLAGGVTLVLTVLGERVFPIGGEPMIGVAALYIARGVGTGFGPILARWVSRSEPREMERLIVYGFLCGAVFYVALAQVSQVAVACVVIACAHLGGATVWVFSTIRLQQIVPTEVRGRVFAAEQGLFTVVLAISTGAYGVAIDAAPDRLSFAVLALGVSLLVPGLLWLQRGRRLGWATEPE